MSRNSLRYLMYNSKRHFKRNRGRIKYYDERNATQCRTWAPQITQLIEQYFPQILHHLFGNTMPMEQHDFNT